MFHHLKGAHRIVLTGVGARIVFNRCRHDVEAVAGGPSNGVLVELQAIRLNTSLLEMSKEGSGAATKFQNPLILMDQTQRRTVLPLVWHVVPFVLLQSLVKGVITSDAWP